MADVEITDEEWTVFLNLASRLGLSISDLIDQESTFTELESAGHQLGRFVAQSTTERLCLKKTVKALSKTHPCPDCRRMCMPDLKEREYVTTDGNIRLHEPACHCSTCRRDFFPSAD